MIRVSSQPLIAGKIVVSRFAGVGIPVPLIPSTGDSGPAFLYNDIAEIGAQPSDELRAEILTRPSDGAFTVNEDSSFRFTGAADGPHYATYRGIGKTGAVYGEYLITLQIGGAQVASNITASLPIATSSVDITLLQNVSITSGVPLPIALISLKEIGNITVVAALPVGGLSANIQLISEIEISSGLPVPQSQIFVNLLEPTPDIDILVNAGLPIPKAQLVIVNILGNISFSEKTIVTIPSEDRFITIEV